MLTVDKLNARAGRAFNLQDVSVSVAPGQVLAVLGPSGSGKSTLLRVIAGLAAPRSGTVAWAGTVLSGNARVVVPPEARGMGMLFQEGVLFPHLDVRANVALGVPHGTPAAQAAAVIDAAMRTARIHGLQDRRVPLLSGGEQQRVALARALAQAPRVLLLDEPFHSLDGPLKREILAEFRAAVTARGLAAVLVTHDAEEAAAFADRVVLLREGRVVQEGSIDELHRQPVNRWAASFLGEVQSLGVEQARRCGVALPDDAAGASAWFRPDAVVLVPGGPHTVAAVRPLGALHAVEVALPGGGSLTAHVPSHASLQPGQAVLARVVRLLPRSVAEDNSP